MKMILYAYLILNKPTHDEQYKLKSLMLRIGQFSGDALAQICGQTLYKLPVYKYWFNGSFVATPLLSTIRLISK
jgi:hypothetical protein